MPLYTQTQPSKSLADRQYTAEFDDAVIEQHFWKNPRYDGCKIISKEINKYTPIQTASNAETGVGFASIVQHGPSLGNMIIGGSGLYNFTVGGIYTNFTSPPPPLNIPGTFIINNFIPKITWPGDSLNPAGLSPNIKNETTAIYIANTVIGDNEDPQFTNIKNHSYLNINQILLIDPSTDETQILDKQSEDFTPFHSFITNDFGSEQLTENNSMYLYKGGDNFDERYNEGVVNSETLATLNGDRIRFRYGTIEMIAGNFKKGHSFEKSRIGPSFKSASIIENKFTQQYYSGSYGHINEPTQPQGTLNSDVLRTSGLGSASKFIGLDTLNFLYFNNINNSVPQQEKTELHITFFEGTKDFSSGSNDERSISTFEIDTNQTQLDEGGPCNAFLPKTHEILLKGLNDDRFLPKTGTYEDSFINAYLTSSNTAGGCTSYGAQTPAVTFKAIQLGINADETLDASVYVQGGTILQEGFQSYQSSSAFTYGRSNLTFANGPLSGSVSASDNLYSGSFSYQLSFLDKDHTIITNLDKTSELFDGIGVKGIVIIPENTNPKIKNNIQFYLQQAGILPTSPNTQVQLIQDA